MATAHGVARRAKATTRKTAANPALELLERAGYIVRGVLYAAMGTFALGLALGLGAYSIWGFVRAIFDPLHRGHDATGIAERLGFAWSGIAYLSIVVFALHIIAGSAASGAHDGTQDAIARI